MSNDLRSCMERAHQSMCRITGVLGMTDDFPNLCELLDCGLDLLIEDFAIGHHYD